MDGQRGRALRGRSRHLWRVRRAARTGRDSAQSPDGVTELAAPFAWLGACRLPRRTEPPGDPMDRYQRRAFLALLTCAAAAGGCTLPALIAENNRTVKASTEGIAAN